MYSEPFLPILKRPLAWSDMIGVDKVFSGPRLVLFLQEITSGNDIWPGPLNLVHESQLVRDRLRSRQTELVRACLTQTPSVRPPVIVHLIAVPASFGQDLRAKY